MLAIRYLSILFFLLTVPNLTYAQEIEYTKKQRELVKKVVSNISKSIDGNDGTDIQIHISNVNAALEKVPNHPMLVLQLFSLYIAGFNDNNFVSEYCQKLELKYLQTNQGLIIEFCATTSYLAGNMDYLLKLIPFIKYNEYKAILYSLYYLDMEEYDRVEEYLPRVLTNDYEIEFYTHFQSMIFVEYLGYLDSMNDDNRIIELLKTYRTNLYSYKLDLNTLFFLINKTITNKEYDLADYLISYCFINRPQDFKYMSIAKAYLNIEKGDKDSAIYYLEKALKLDDSAFDVFLNKSGTNSFPVYFEVLKALDDNTAKLDLIAKMLDFFEGRSSFYHKVQLYQSSVFASNNLDKAMSVLNSYKDKMYQKDYQTFKQLLEIQNELHKDTPNYKRVNKKLNSFESVLDEAYFLDLRIGYQIELNYNENHLIFDKNQIIEDLDRLIKITAEEEQALRYTFLKIATVVDYNSIKFYEELEKLDPDRYEKIKAIAQESEISGFIEKDNVKNAIKGIKRFPGLNHFLIEKNILEAKLKTE